MDSLWGDLSNLNEVKTPKQILEEQATILKNATSGRVYASVAASIADNDLFEFSFIIRSIHFEKYRYMVLTIDHDSHFYPLKVYLNENINKEIDNKDILSFNIPYRKCQNEEEFKNLLGDALKTNEVKSVIYSLYNLSK